MECKKYESLKDLFNSEESDQFKLSVVNMRVIDMVTHNSIKKDELIDVVRYLYPIAVDKVKKDMGV